MSNTFVTVFVNHC